MKIRFIALVLLLIFAFVSVHAQISLSGRVVSKQSGQTIPYANIGIIDTEVGTISNADGSFSIIIPEKYAERKLLFSSVGYQRISISVSELPVKSELEIQLQEQIIDLHEIEIKAHQPKRKEITMGNGISLLLSGQLHYDTLYAGAAMALLIDNTKEELNLRFLDIASLYIAKNLSPEFKVRLRIMSFDSVSHAPGDDLLSVQMIKTSSIKRGWLHFDFTENPFIYPGKFYVVFEWLLDKKDRADIACKYAEYMETYPEKVYYDTIIIDEQKVSMPMINKVVAGTIFGVTKSRKDLKTHTCFYRSNSFGEWKRSNGILSAKVTMTNSKFDKIKQQAKSPCNDLNCEINQWADAFKQQYDIQGLQLSIAKDDSLIYSNGVGFANKAHKTQVSPHTQFRIASVSKTMTSAAIIQLYSRGLLNLDTTIQTYVPEFPEKKHTITVR